MLNMLAIIHSQLESSYREMLYIHHTHTKLQYTKVQHKAKNTSYFYFKNKIQEKKILHKNK